MLVSQHKELPCAHVCLQNLRWSTRLTDVHVEQPQWAKLVQLISVHTMMTRCDSLECLHLEVNFQLSFEMLNFIHSFVNLSFASLSLSRLITSRLETSIFRVISRHYGNVKVSNRMESPNGCGNFKQSIIILLKFFALMLYLGNIYSIFPSSQDVHVKQNLIRATELIGKALEPSRLQQPEFTFTKRKELIDHMLVGSEDNLY